MSEPIVIARQDGKTGRITLNNPKALHALNMEMCQLVTDALLAWRADSSVEQILIDHADGTRGFCAGGDIKLLASSGAKDGKEAAVFFETEYRMNTLLKNYPKPVIAVIHGVTMGGGVGISVHGQIRIATERTTFAMPESGIGLLPDVGGGWFLPRLEGELGTWLGLTGARLKGLDVLAAGIATHFVPEAELEALKAKLIDDGLPTLDGLQTQANGSWEQHADVINACFLSDDMQAIMDALDASSSEWANSQASDLKTKCPQTLRVALRQMREGAKAQTFEDVMRMEYRITTRMVCSPDFQEGVRAVLIDKDSSPKWSHASVADVPDALVDSFFEGLGDNELKFLEETK